MTLELQILELRILHFLSVELEIGAIISFKVISWYEVTLLLQHVESIVL